MYSILFLVGIIKYNTDRTVACTVYIICRTFLHGMRTKHVLFRHTRRDNELKTTVRVKDLYYYTRWYTVWIRYGTDGRKS